MAYGVSSSFFLFFSMLIYMPSVRVRVTTIGLVFPSSFTPSALLLLCWFYCSLNPFVYRLWDALFHIAYFCGLFVELCRFLITSNYVSSFIAMFSLPAILFDNHALSRWEVECTSNVNCGGKLSIYLTCSASARVSAYPNLDEDNIKSNLMDAVRHTLHWRSLTWFSKNVCLKNWL